MKNLMLIILLALTSSLNPLAAQEAVAVNSVVEVTKPLIKWDQTVFDFGAIPQGVPAKASFTLTNTSDQPLLLKEVKPSCGCTVAAYEQDPILPGESTVITTTYNAKKGGNFQKTIKVMTNLDTKPIPLKIKGTVMEQESN